MGKATVKINHDFVDHNLITTITLLARMLTFSALRAREGPSSGPSRLFWEGKALSSHLLDIMGTYSVLIPHLLTCS